RPTTGQQRAEGRPQEKKSGTGPLSPAPRAKRAAKRRSLRVYWVSITWVLERVLGNGTPRKDGLADELLRKITDLASMVSVIWTPVPAARCAAQGVVVEPPAAVQAIATAIPPAGGEDPHTTPACAIFPIYPVPTVETGAWGEPVS